MTRGFLSPLLSAHRHYTVDGRSAHSTHGGSDGSARRTISATKCELLQPTR
jgi:hypothetical protein